MELRHLRYFLTVAEELHFARAAEKLHMDQSPLSRAIKDLEDELGAKLFTRTTRNIRLTHAGKVFLERVPRIFEALEQARDGAKSAASGFHGQLRIALSDGITPSRLPALLARSREEEPEVEIRLFEVPLDQQIRGLQEDLYDAGLSMADEVGDGIVTTPAWDDELMVALSLRHPLLEHRRIPLEMVLQQRLVLGDPAACQGHTRQIDRILQKRDEELQILQRVATFDVMMALVSAGLAVGLAGAAHIASSKEPGVKARQLAGTPPMLTTYLLRRDTEPSPMLTRFIQRVVTMDSAGADNVTDS
ncbi:MULTISPECIES: LysR family transcriptional regulator [Pseudomonadota]|uniref:DNA-binding transcriptional LysR family regulator n=5 Tax=Pseudomonadota TaxID=1224 RepID=A0A7W6BIC8_9SPHN|nr:MULTISPECIES: LysR family transcriptional regulator [Pseudomonadota]EKT4562950.1 LysR family transcriptional regulator [Pseudomonas putida]MBS0401500.1 LysR family transcriptional regulator [Pseudomonadota bacterium]MDK7586914.1 LysR family transcriptional regulator [Alcaligenes phenolicus]RUP33545.1 MAG: LysR family transcriptional regulator [Curvibacter sp.]AMG37761.1 LysR family transcriptional regulator [Achromobacter xylosoxidans]